jgi:coproporphyrinogen III oxidase-like Fe-S oxidoreductase
VTTQSIPVGTSAPPAFDSPFVDKLLLLAFRFRTRGFLRMKDVAGTVPPIPSEGAGYLYVHIPFCEVLCPFCSFHRVQHKHGLAQQYFALLRDEIRLYHVAGHRFTGVYFGGGTPTCEPDELIETIGLVRKLYGVREVSVETNPNDLRPELLARLRDAGVTRLSIGVQSFDDGLLRDMDRHDKYGSSAMVQENIRVAAGYFPTVNVDLIFNLPHRHLRCSSATSPSSCHWAPTRSRSIR